MSSNAFDMIVLPLFQGWGLGFLAIAAAWALLTTAIRIWCRLLDYETEVWPEIEPPMIHQPSPVFWTERTARHA